mgnify:CR=1 FL=1
MVELVLLDFVGSPSRKFLKTTDEDISNFNHYFFIFWPAFETRKGKGANCDLIALKQFSIKKV